MLYFNCIKINKNSVKIVSWNVNGLRAIAQKKDFWNFLDNESPDIFGMQEIKSKINQLSMELFQPAGYFAYFNPAQRPGYSGVAVYTKKEALSVKYGIGIDKFDCEGRIIELDFGDFVYFNIYFPNGGSGDERLKYKLEFYEEFLKYLDNLRKNGKKNFVIAGDYNTAHKEIDLARPKDNENISGFMPCERVWIDKYINEGLVDSFRYFHPDKSEIYSWWSFRTAARNRNIGWRIDYQMVSDDLMKYVKNADIMTHIMGSDHCPVLLEPV